MEMESGKSRIRYISPFVFLFFFRKLSKWMWNIRFVHFVSPIICDNREK